MGGSPMSSGENHGRAANAMLSDGAAVDPSQAEQPDQPTLAEPVWYRCPPATICPETAGACARLLGVLLLEPGRWPDVQKHVSLHDFSDELHHKLADLYWLHQQDEGEPVFNEFLGLLNDENLRELAIIAVQDAESLADLGALVDESLAFFEESRQRAEGQKLLSEVQRINTDEGDDLLKKLQDQARQPNLRRI